MIIVTFSAMGGKLIEEYAITMIQIQEHACNTRSLNFIKLT